MLEWTNKQIETELNIFRPVQSLTEPITFVYFYDQNTIEHLSFKLASYFKCTLVYKGVDLKSILRR